MAYHTNAKRPATGNVLGRIQSRGAPNGQPGRTVWQPNTTFGALHLRSFEHIAGKIVQLVENQSYSHIQGVPFQAQWSQNQKTSSKWAIVDTPDSWLKDWFRTKLEAPEIAFLWKDSPIESFLFQFFQSLSNFWTGSQAPGTSVVTTGKGIKKAPNLVGGQVDPPKVQRQHEAWTQFFVLPLEQFSCLYVLPVFFITSILDHVSFDPCVDSFFLCLTTLAFMLRHNGIRDVLPGSNIQY